ATDSEDHDEWMSFLAMLRKYRSKMPINGVIVALSVTDLAEATDEQLDEHAKKLRARIDEVMTRLQMVVPVYLMITKADLIAGFVEFWGDLRKSDRAQIWGITYPLAGAAGRDVAKAFEVEFDRLVDEVHARALGRIASERQLAMRQRAFQFPLEFAALKSNLSEFLHALFQPNAFQETLGLRGVYFTSGTQEGRPIDRVIGTMMKAFNIAPAATAAAPQTESKSYFVTDFFRRVVFPDQYLAGRTRGELQRQWISRVAFAVVALLLAFLVVLPSSCTYLGNQELIAKVKGVVAEANAIRWNDANASVSDKAKHLDNMRTQLLELDTWRQEGAPLRYRWGMYTGDKLYEPLRNAYVGNLQVGFATPTKARLEEELRSIPVTGRLTVDQYNAFFIRLKGYLMASDLTRLEPDWESVVLTDTWSRVSGTARGDKEQLKSHVLEYFRLMKRDEVAPWTVDSELITRVRSILRQVSEADRDYSALIRDANENVASITRDTVFLNTAFANFVRSRSTPEVVVRGAFVRVGWENYVRDKLDKERAKQLAQDRWVLGETEQVSVERMERVLQDLQDRYFNDYRNAWADFLRDLDVRTPDSNAEALDELVALSEIPLPYGKLLKTLAENTRLQQPEVSLAERRGGDVLRRVADEAKKNAAVQTVFGDAGVPDAPKRWVSPVEEAFRPMTNFGVPADGKPGDKPAATGLSHYQEQIIAKVVGVLTDQKDSQTPPDAKAMATVFQEAFRGTSELMASSQSGFTRPLLSPLLMNPIRMSYAGVLKDVAAGTGGKWELEVWKKWHDTLEDRYPFADSPKDATLADFVEFFRPQTGLLWAFYEASLKGSMERSGDTFVPTTRFQHSIRFRPEFVRCYERGAQITSATFPPKSEQPKLEFEVNLHSVSDSIAEVTFEVDGVGKTYRNEPEQWLRVEWPAKEPKDHGARLRIRGINAQEEELARAGDFGLFRLLDAATSIVAGTEGPTSGAKAKLIVTWSMRMQGAVVKMELRPPRLDSAFTSYLTRRERIFRGYTCPRLISSGVK
ncbi:MAG: type VI secretion system membrane subunit TssM, partial [Myxococcales bacterium]